jgi:Ca2+-binding RTX toxin-like protein
MFRRSLAASALLAAMTFAGSVQALTPAVGVGETCQGRQATIVGTGPDIAGTPGDDVIVTGVSVNIDAGAGNDLICVAPRNADAEVSVDAGDGNDFVDASTAYLTSADLGEGADRYFGGTNDFVSANGLDDQVTSVNEMWAQITDPPTANVGRYTASGRGHARITISSAALDVAIDLTEGRITVAGTSAASLASFVEAVARAPQATVRGDGKDNYLAAEGCDVRILGEGGDDWLNAWNRSSKHDFECEGSATVYGGRGDDLIDGSDGADRLYGNPGADKFRAGRGNDLAVGGGGADDISGRADDDVVRGGSGNDTLRGQNGRDALVGNQGRDIAYGGGGRDRCLSEQRHHCEH